jgi:hypothetical protein
VLAEDTGFSEHLPTGEGLLAFRTMDEAVAAVSEIDRRYAFHARAARQLASDVFDARGILATMIEASR